MSCLDKKHILEIEHLNVSFLQYEKGMRQRELKVITDLNVSVHEGEIVAVVGSSGSGKSLLAHAVLGLLPANADVSGNIWFDDRKLTPEDIIALRGKEITLVPQSTTFLDPLQKVGKAVRKSRKEEGVVKRQRELFKRFRLKEETEDLYPFELSGGMARRVLLSSALMESPRLIIADEPTPGLDLPLAKKAMEDFRAFADQGNGVLLITHDIELALEVADRIAVFYAGTTVEEAPIRDFKSEATLRHPYTRALWRALPQNGFQALPGAQPYVKDMPEGCPFAPRCDQADEECKGEIPVRILRCGTVRCVKVKADMEGHHHGSVGPWHHHGPGEDHHHHYDHGKEYHHTHSHGEEHHHHHIENGVEIRHDHDHGEEHHHHHHENGMDIHHDHSHGEEHHHHHDHDHHDHDHGKEGGSHD